jgi:hypothetical protein
MGCSFLDGSGQQVLPKLQLPTLFLYRDTGYFALVDDLDITESVQDNQMTPANKCMLPILDRSYSPVVGGYRKRRERFSSQ